MYAYRASNPTCAGSDDGGESGSGERLERLLEMRCPNANVMVVVLRWYGGIKLGSDRWKYISRVAKEALDSGGFGELQVNARVQEPRRNIKAEKR